MILNLAGDLEQNLGGSEAVFEQYASGLQKTAKDAYKNMGSLPVPLIVRLQGTNAVEAKKMIDYSGLNVHSSNTLEEAANKVKEVLA